MEMKFAQCVNKGMQRDYSMSTASQEFAYENKNIRITTTGNESFLTVGNEKSTEQIKLLYNDGELFDIQDFFILGNTTINDKVILFATTNYTYGDSWEEGEDCDRIFTITINRDTKEGTVDRVYGGNLKFRIDHPIECTTSYESEDVQKVYWVDGVNQPRVVNICKLDQTEHTTNLDFSPKIGGNIKVEIEKEQNGAGLFPAGVIQYYITYYNKYGQESQPAYISPLYYISPNSKGGKADVTQTCSFKLTISDTDPKYDHIRVYSVVRSSKNAEYTVSIVKDLSIETTNKIYQIIDTNTNLVNVPSSDILFLGGSAVYPSTIEQKDGTLFLGNIKTGTNKISEELDSLKAIFGGYRDDAGVLTNSDILKFKYKVIPRNDETGDVLYSYNPSLNSNLVDTHYKLREKYRIGIQFIHETGEQSQTVYIGDVINKEHYPHYMSQDVMSDFGFPENIQKIDDYYIDNDNNIHLYDVTNKELKYVDYLCLPIITFDCEQDSRIINCLNSIKIKGFKSYRLMVAETDYKDKSILCQGYINPLTFRLGRRKNNECYGQESWSIRPIGTYSHLENINKCKDEKYTEFSEIRSSIKEGQYTSAAALNVDLNTQSKIDRIILKGYVSNEGLFNNKRIRYEIYIWGTDAEGNRTWVNRNGGSASRFTIENCYYKDVVDEFPSLDTWDSTLIARVCNAFNISKTELANAGIVENSRIFGYTPPCPWTPKWGESHVLYHEDVRDLCLSFSNVDLDKTEVYKENYYLDASKASFNTPDIENIQDVLSSDPNIKCRIVGKINIDKVITDYNITLDDTIDGFTSSSVYRFNFSKVLNKDETAIGLKNFPTVYSAVDNKAYSLMMFDKDGTVTAKRDSIEPNKESPKTLLKNKSIGNLWYASKTDYEFHWRYYRYDGVDYHNTEYGEDWFEEWYYPKNQEYKKARSIEDITDNYTDKKDDWTWYTGLIEYNLDLYNNKVCLWDSEKYFNEHLYLKNIEDLTYNKNWKWIRTSNAVTSYTNMNEIKEHLENTDFIESQNQVRIKYNSSKSVLLELSNANIYDIQNIPGYYNYDIQGTVKYLWDATPFCSSDDKIHYIELVKDRGSSYIPVEFPEYDTDIYDYSKIFYVNKTYIRDISNRYADLSVGTKYFFKGFDTHDKHITSLYEGTVVECLSFDENDKYDSEYYYKFEIVEVAGSSYTTLLEDYDGSIWVPLYKYTKIYNSDTNITYELPRYTPIKHNDNLDYYLTPHTSSLESTLGGKKVLGDYYNSSLFYKLDSEWSDRYLPFNLKGGIFDYPYPKSWEIRGPYGEFGTHSRGGEVEGNGLNNSLWICELYKDFDTFDFLGGCSENAVELNTFIPASQIHSIGDVLYGVYGDTYFKRWDHLRIYPTTDDDQTNGVVDTVSLMIETYINLDGDTRDARKRLDIRNMRPSNMEGLVNDVYSQKDNIITSRVLDDKFNVVSHPIQYWWSLTKIPNADIDSWTGVTLTSVAELDGDKGPLNKIKRWNNQLFAFQDEAIAMINFNNQTAIATQEGVPVEIQNSGKVNGHYYITTNNGCKNKWSIVESPVGLYFIDSYNKSISVIGDGIKSLSQLNLFQDWIEQEEQGNIWDPLRFTNAFKGFYDPIHKEVYFANGKDCICYNELLEQFTSFYDYEKMNYMFLMDNHIYSIPSSNKLYLMFEGKDYCNLYDKQRDYYMQYKVNNEPFIDKTWTNLEYRADIFNSGNIQTNEFDTNAILSNETFDSLKVWNEYQNGELDLNKISFGYLRGAKPKFRIWRTNLPRAKSTDTNRFGLDRMRNPWIMLELRKSADSETSTNKRMEFHDLIVKYVI